MSNVILAVGIKGVGLAEDLAPPLRGHSGWATEWQMLGDGGLAALEQAGLESCRAHRLSGSAGIDPTRP
jgi:hypothetical protein